MLVLWAVRLTGNWVYSFPGLHHEDWRYGPMKERARATAPVLEPVVDLMGIHVIPTIQVFLGMVPVYVVTREGRGLGWLDVVAVVVGLGAVALETVADVQMHRFGRTKQPGQVMDRGLWAWSRHPNYFGEFSFWLSLGLFGLAASPSSWWVARRRRRDARDVPRREHPDDGEAQPRAPAGLPGRRRPGLPVRAATAPPRPPT